MEPADVGARLERACRRDRRPRPPRCAMRAPASAASRSRGDAHTYTRSVTVSALPGPRYACAATRRILDATRRIASRQPSASSSQTSSTCVPPGRSIPPTRTSTPASGVERERVTVAGARADRLGGISAHASSPQPRVRPEWRLQAGPATEHDDALRAGRPRCPGSSPVAQVRRRRSPPATPRRPSARCRPGSPRRRRRPSGRPATRSRRSRGPPS